MHKYAITALVVGVFVVAIALGIYFTVQEKDNIKEFAGFTFHPQPEDGRLLIWYKSHDFAHWKNRLDALLNMYNDSNNQNRDNLVHCKPGDSPPDGKACEVAIDDSWGPCNLNSNYEFDNFVSGPCIYLQFNKVFDWRPKYYDVLNYPKEMPEWLAIYLEIINGTSLVENIWVSCDGQNEVDKENIGPIAYYPNSFFPGFYFPIEDVKGHLPPLIAVHFKKLRRGILINIECTIWAANIPYDTRRSSLHFEILIDS